jgi:hypothetical protein
LDIDEVRERVGAFDAKSLIYPWEHSVPGVDRLSEDLQDIVAAAEKLKQSRAAIFERIWRAANRAADRRIEEKNLVVAAAMGVPYLNEPWYC